MAMSEAAFEKQVLQKLDSMDKRISHIIEYIEDSKLTADEKQILEDSLKSEKEGRLLSSKDMRKRLVI